MSTKYNSSKEVPTDTLSKRLEKLSDAVVARLNGDMSTYEREFTVRIPAECDRDADLVLSEASRRLKINKINIAKEKIISLVREYVENAECKCDNTLCCWRCLFEYNLNFIKKETKDG